MWNWCYHKLPSFVYVHFGFQLRINTLSQLKHVDNEFTMFSCESQRFIFCGCNKITLVHLNRNSAYTRRITVICIYSVIHVYYNCIQIAKLNRIWEWNLNYSLSNGEKNARGKLVTHQVFIETVVRQAKTICLLTKRYLCRLNYVQKELNGRATFCGCKKCSFKRLWTLCWATLMDLAKVTHYPLRIILVLHLTSMQFPNVKTLGKVTLQNEFT